MWAVRELPGGERDRVYAEQARRYPGFAEYERQTAGVRTIPVLELSRGIAGCQPGSRASSPGRRRPDPRWETGGQEGPAPVDRLGRSVSAGDLREQLVWYDCAKVYADRLGRTNDGCGSHTAART
jgi:hypothetical protein